MASTKKNTAITADDCMKIMKEHFDGASVIEWCGKKITIKKCIILDEFIEFVKEVVDNSYTPETNTYRPEIRDFTIRAATIKHYTDIALPEDTRDMFMFVYMTDVYDVIYQNIDKEQFHALLNAVNKKIDAMVGEAISASANGINKLIGQVETMISSFAKMFEGLTQEDVNAVTKALTSGGNIEERLLQAYQKIKTEG